MKIYVTDRRHLTEPLPGLCEPPDWEVSVCLKSEVDEEMKQLEKEEEWLIEHCYKLVSPTPIYGKTAYKLALLSKMQQALKEKSVRRYDNKGAPID